MHMGDTATTMRRSGMRVDIYGSSVVVLVALLISSFMVVALADPSNMSTALLIRVDQGGNGDYKKIQDAIDSVPSNNTELVFIWVKPGTYREKVVIPADKPFITISGSTPGTNIITWSDGGEIYETPTFSVLATDFVARFLTIQNTFGPSRKAVALRISADRAAFYSCRILSYQDTLLDDVGRHYYSNCYIEGATDFIFGSAASLYEKCHIHSLSFGQGAITAHKRNSEVENTGYVFLGGRVTGVGNGKTFLGRPWGAHARVVFALTYMSSAVLPQGWNDWDDISKQSTVYYGEYKCYGPGAVTSGRIGWSHNLSEHEAAPFLTKDMIGGRAWLRPTPTIFKRRSTIIWKKAGGH